MKKLSFGLLWGAFVTCAPLLAGAQTYSVTTSAASLDTLPTPVSVGLGDDSVSGIQPIGFTFNFFGVDYSDFYISSNGFITFTSTFNDGCCVGQAIPDASSPNNLIAGYWSDLNPSAGGTISYETLGAPGSRRLVVEFDSVPHFASAITSTFQIKLREGSNVIEIHCQSCTSDGGSMTQGIEDDLGGEAYFAAGRSAADFSASDAVFYVPAAFAAAPAAQIPTLSSLGLWLMILSILAVVWRLGLFHRLDDGAVPS